MNIHDSLPDGFTYADRLQVAQYAKTGNVHGAAKVILVRAPSDGAPIVAVRLAPPKYDRTLTRRMLIRRELQQRGLKGDRALSWYRDEYERGWRAGLSGNWPSGSFAFDDGYLDRAAGRPKWHLAHCEDHDLCGEG